MSTEQEIWWLTGASSGIGYTLALALANAGKKVVVSARSEDSLKELATKNPNIIAKVVDVTDLVSTQTVIADIENTVGPIHGAILNAGIYEPMPSDEFSFASVERTFDVNVLGMARALDTLIPLMTERGKGHIALMGSLAGWRGLPKAVAYGASKAAVGYMGEVLRVELEPKNIIVQVIHPGFVDTPATKVNTFKMPFLMTPDQAAERIMKGLSHERLTISFPTPFATIFRILRLLPDRWYVPLVRRMTKGES